MANTTMGGKRPLVNASEFRGSGKSRGGGGGGGMDTASKIKAGASIVAILVAILFLAFYFDVFGGDDLPPDVTAQEVEQLPPEEVKQIEEQYQEELQKAEQRGIPAVGS